MTCWKQGAKRQFDSWSRSYDRSILQRYFFKPAHDDIIARLQGNPGLEILDLGCGTGRLVHRLVHELPDAKVAGIDISEGMLDCARQRCDGLTDRVDLRHGDSEHLPFPDRTFDAVVCVHSFHHYPRQREVMREVARVLKPGGRMLLVDANRDSWWGWALFDGVVASIERNVHHCSARRFTWLAEVAGFERCRIERRGWLTPYLIVDSQVSPAGIRRTPAFLAPIRHAA
jgi:ubiquinone/menaquinone biosynthesis C-methylase UbiE